MPIDPKEIARIFDHAIQIHDPQEQRKYVFDACAGNTEQQQEIFDLLSAHERAGSFLTNPGFESDSFLSGESHIDFSNQTIGPFTILDRIGEGGFGVVYRAEQSAPIKREVAIKLLKPGMGSSEILGRFDAERNSLARMNHTNIARVIDGGVTGHDVPYFVMDLVRGKSIVDYCDDNQMPIRERLELFIQVCNGVHHAHQKGIIHRDLKPNNILIAEDDTNAHVPIAKIIDFGIAKITQETEDLDSQNTRRGQVLGTPMYMSPEQAGFGKAEVDSRTDIYSLGIILFEILTGTTPITREEIKSSRFDEVLQSIREKENPKPSSRINETKLDVDAISSNRQLRPAQLASTLKGDLDWIVLTALAKEPDLRYESAAAFAKDIRRYLNNQPIEARPPAWSYRTRKFVSKHKVMISVVAIFVVALLGTTVFSVVQAKRAIDNQERADSALTAERKAKREAIEKENLATSALQTANSERRAFEGLWRFTEDSLVSPILSGSQFHDEARIALEQKAAEAEIIFADLPRAQAEVYRMFALNFQRLGIDQRELDYQRKSVEQHELAYGPSHPQTLGAKVGLAHTLSKLERLAESQQLLPVKSDIDLTTEFGKRIWINLLYVQSNNAWRNRDFEKSLKLSGECLKAARESLGEFDPMIAQACHQYARALGNLKRHVEAKEYYLEALRQHLVVAGTGSVEYCDSLKGLAFAYGHIGQKMEALRLSKHALVISRNLLQPTSPHYLEMMLAHAQILEATGEVDEAINVQNEMVEIAEKSPNARTNQLIQIYSDMGHALAAGGRSKEAHEAHRKSYQASLESNGFDHPLTLVSAVNLGISFSNNGQPDEGVKLLTKCLEPVEKHWGKNHRQTIEAIDAIATAAAKGNQHALAVKYYQQLLEIFKRRDDISELETADAKHWLARSLIELGRTAEAGPHIQFAFDKRTDAFGPNNPDTLASQYLLAACLQGEGRLEDAFNVYEQTYERLLGTEVIDPEKLLASYEGMATVSLLSKKLDRAIAIQRHVVAMRDEKMGPDDPLTLASKLSLGIMFFHANDFDASIAVLEKCVGGLDESDASYSHVHDTLHLCYMHNREFQTALDHIEKLLDAIPDDIPNHDQIINSAKLNQLVAFHAINENERFDELFLKYMSDTSSAGTDAVMVKVQALVSVAANLDRYRFYEKGKTIFQQAYELLVEDRPEDRIRFNVQEVYGSSILRAAIALDEDSDQREPQFALAEKHLLNSCENIKRFIEKDGQSNSIIYERNVTNLVKLYTAWNKPEQLEKWEQELKSITKKPPESSK